MKELELTQGKKTISHKSPGLGKIFENSQYKQLTVNLLEDQKFHGPYYSTKVLNYSV